ncbi:hypothetical protein [Halorubrum trueperi]|uniref:Uncharacterized protein n=1 Tax=Halorubrum trueperi TaxID=2004704 RepID=A0ABD5UM41_9EURY
MMTQIAAGSRFAGETGGGARITGNRLIPEPGAVTGIPREEP